MSGPVLLLCARKRESVLNSIRLAVEDFVCAASDSSRARSPAQMPPRWKAERVKAEAAASLDAYFKDDWMGVIKHFEAARRLSPDAGDVCAYAWALYKCERYADVEREASAALGHQQNNSALR
jgi:hypothetical protein